MKPLTIISALALLVVAAPAQAEGNRIYVDVNGLVCDFCARALEKVFNRQEAVSEIDVDLNAKVITIDLKNGMTLADELIAELVNDAGYSIVEIRHDEGSNQHGT